MSCSPEICINVPGKTTQHLSQIRIPAQNRTGCFPYTRKKRCCLYHSVGFVCEYAQVKLYILYKRNLDTPYRSTQRFFFFNLTFMGPCIANIFQYISNKMQLYTVYLYLETALHVSGGTFSHHEERIQLYLQQLVFVTPLVLPAAIVKELER